jgi:hypothetical protein
MDQEQFLELLMDKVRHPRKYDHVCIPHLPGLYDCILHLRQMGITRRLNASLNALYDRIEQEHNLPTIAKNYSPQTLLK